MVVEGLKNLSVLGKHRDQRSRLHGLDHISYLVVVQASQI